MGAILSLAGTTFLQNIIFLIVLGLIIIAIILIVFFVIKRLIEGRDLQIGKWVKINNSKKDAHKEGDVITFSKEEFLNSLTKIKNQLTDYYINEESKIMREIVDSLILFHETLYIMTNRIIDIYEGLLLLTEPDVNDVFMNKELNDDFIEFKSILIGARKYTIKKTAAVICKFVENDKILREKNFDKMTIDNVTNYIKKKYKGTRVSRKDLFKKIEDAHSHFRFLINSRHNNDVAYDIGKRNVYKEKYIKEIVDGILNGKD